MLIYVCACLHTDGCYLYKVARFWNMPSVFNVRGKSKHHALFCEKSLKRNVFEELRTKSNGSLVWKSQRLKRRKKTDLNKEIKQMGRPSMIIKRFKMVIRKKWGRCPGVKELKKQLFIVCMAQKKWTLITSSFWKYRQGKIWTIIIHELKITNTEPYLDHMNNNHVKFVNFISTVFFLYMY